VLGIQGDDPGGSPSRTGVIAVERLDAVWLVESLQLTSHVPDPAGEDNGTMQSVPPIPMLNRSPTCA